MKWWIVGKRGLLGQSFCRYCDKEGIDYIATSSQDLNILDEDAVKSFDASFSHLINCAAYTAVDRAEDEEEAAFALNDRAVGHLAKKAQSEGARMIHFSTDYVFDGKSRGPYDEEDIPNPQTIYGKSKLAGERRLMALMPDALIARTSWLFGGEAHHFVKTMVTLLTQPKEVRVVNDQWGQPTFAPDLVAMVAMMCDQSGLYHLSGKGVTTWFHFAQAISEELKERACGRLIPVRSDEYPTRAKRPAYSVLSLEKVERALGRTPRVWNLGLKEYIDETCR